MPNPTSAACYTRTGLVTSHANIRPQHDSPTYTCVPSRILIRHSEAHRPGSTQCGFHKAPSLSTHAAAADQDGGWQWREELNLHYQSIPEPLQSMRRRRSYCT